MPSVGITTPPEQVAYCHELLGRCGVFLSPAFDGALHGHTLRDAHGEVRVWLMPFLRPSAVRPYFENVRTFEDAVRAALSTVAREPDMRHVLVAHQYVTGRRDLRFGNPLAGRDGSGGRLAL